MVASIDNLKSTISSRGGIARPNNFLVELPSLPGFSRASDPLNILCTKKNLHIYNDAMRYLMIPLRP